MISNSRKLGIVLLGILSATLTVIILSRINDQTDDLEGYATEPGEEQEFSNQEPLNNPSLDKERELPETNIGDSENKPFADTISELIARADSGDPDAQYETYTNLIECNGLEEQSKVQILVDTATDLGTPYSNDYVDYLWSMHLKCKTIPIENLRDTAFQYLSLAQHANHPAAVAYQLIDIASEKGLEVSDDIAVEVLKSGNPEAIYNTAPYLYFRHTLLPLEQQHKTLNRDVVSAALQIWACNLGWDQCRPKSRLMIMNCFLARQESCDANESLLDYASHAMWTHDLVQKATTLAWEWQDAVENGESPNIFAGEKE